MDIAGLRLSHSKVKFIGTEPGELHQETITLQNISSGPKKVVVRPTKHKLFRIIVNNKENKIAPGVQISARIEYSADKREDAKDECIVSIDEDLIKIPLLAFVSVCDLRIDPEIDFGTAVANSKLLVKEVNVQNHGTLSGQFLIVDRNNLPFLVITPKCADVLPNTQQLVKIELCTVQPMVLDEMLLVRLEGAEDTTLRVKANIVASLLEVLDFSGQKLDCVRFGGTYYGTSKLDQVVLYNNSPETIDWVTVMENNALGSEVGTDLSLSSDAVLANRKVDEPTPIAYTFGLITCQPCQGILHPYNKTVVTLCFNPKDTDPFRFHKKENEIPHYREYALYVRFEALGSCDTFMKKSSGSIERKDQPQVELALTGIGFRVCLNISPVTEFDFKECLLGEKAYVISTLRNDSPLLPLCFRFPKIAHFQITPAKGRIKPGQSKDIIICFAAEQLGIFRVIQLIKFFGLVMVPDNPIKLKMQPFHQMKITLLGVCKASVKKLEPKSIPQITPAIANEPETLAQQTTDRKVKYIDSCPVTLPTGCESLLFQQNRSKNVENKAPTSKPDGRGASTRSSNRIEKYTEKTHQQIPVDPEYTYNDDEAAAMKAHKKYYEDFIRHLRLRRSQKQDRREFEQFNNTKDIGLRPAEGLNSPYPEVTPFMPQRQPLKICSTVPPPRKHKPKVKYSNLAEKPARDGLNAVPSSLQEEMDCSLFLTPQQIHQISIGPTTIDFGNVCVYSTSKQILNIVNNLPTYILIEVTADYPELRESSPLSQVVPPTSAACLPIIFESPSEGAFQKSIDYKINNHHVGRILILANVVCVALELSTNEVVLTPNYGFLAETGFRTTVRLYNRRNYPAQFSWSPILSEVGIAFFIRPDGGIVDAFNDVECEVAWHASFFSPKEGEFDLIVHHGNKLRLKCIAKLGHVNIRFAESRLLFKSASWNLTTMKTAILKNYGQHHAYFKVRNVHPVPGMTVTPAYGIVPVGGHVLFKIFFHPTTVFKFDTRLKLDIRNSKLLKLRVGGSVIRPMAEIDVKSFVFHGIYCGSSSTIPFTLINSTESPIKLEFDFAKYRDFSLNFEASADATQDLLNYQLYIVSLRGRERIKCELVFSPTDVASYDFNLPVIINGSVTPSPPPSSIPPDPYDEISIGSSEVQLLNSATPSRRVQATVLYPPLELSDTKLEFSLLPGYNDMGAIVADPFVKKVEIHNTSSKEIKWLFDLDSQQNSTLEDGTFRIFNYCGNIKPGERHCITIGFCTQCPGKYRCEIPMFINEDRISPYRVITLIGVIHIPKLFIDPPFVILNPVPLGTEISATVQITCLDYLSDCILQAEVPETETEEGNWIKPFTCQFPEGSTLPFRSETIRSITCCIIFCSFCPISVSANVTLIDQDRSRFTLPVSVSADNCLLSIYRYIALHSTDQHIVLKTGTNASKHDSIGKVILQPYYTPAASTRSSSTITRFSPSTSSFEESVTDSSRNADSKVEKKDTESEAELLGRKNYLGDLLFSAENITEDIFYQRVLNAVRTWFTLFGWPNGMNPVSIPESLRSTEHIGRDTKTIYEMLNHLSGQWLPGFTGKKPLLGDPMERLLQLHWQYSTLLTFLKVQGACLAHVKPEFLLEPEQFKQWNQLQGCSQITESTEIFKLGDGVFESVSKRSWTDLLLQIYKITVLSRLTLKDINNILCDQKHSENIPRINIEPSSSNIYSTGELVLLTWLNHHYETKRCVVWECCQKGAIPPTRWIINFDLDLLDGLVLAAVVAAYCPHLIPTHFENMYTSPAAPEQCLHNSLILLKAFDTIGLDFDIQATDISDPNPITMLMLCVYLYERLPNYRPKMTVEFTGELHATIVKHVRLQNPFMKDLVYFATIVGKEANDFTLPNGNEVVIPERSHVDINVEFTSRFLKPEQALLIFVSRLRKGVAAATTTFLLTSQINGINPTDTFKCESPCFKQKRMQLNIFNPLNVNGLFSVILMETRISLFKTEDFACIAALLDKVKMQNQKIKVRFSDLQPEPGGFGNNVFGNGAINQNMGQKMSLQENWVSEYFCEINSLNLEPQRYSVLEILYLPFHIGKSYCTILLMNEQIGEFVYCLEGTGCIPLPCTGLEVFSPDAVSNYCAAPDNKNATQVILYYKCNANCTFDQEVKIPLINEAREKALAIVGQQQMSQTEYKRRKIAGTLESSSVRASAAASNPCCTQKNVLHALTTDCTGPKVIEYTVELSMPGNFECPDKISIPVSRARRVTAESPETCGRNVNKTDKEDSAILPMKFFAKGPGRYPCQIFLRSPCDIRLYNIVCVVNPEDNLETELEVIASTHQSVIKNIPLHNDSQEDWKLKAVLEGKDFFGPSMMYIQACETSMYPLMFKPNFECVTMGKLVLMNETDGTERTINLKGIGKKPVAVDHVMIDCQVRQITRQVLMVPNYTQTRLTCKVVSDLVIVSGEPYITLKAGQTAPYLLNILPWKRGKFTGVISFVVEDETQQQQIPQCSSSVEKLDNEQPATNETSVACEASGDVNSEKNILYRVWFYLEINATPAPPEQCLCVTCAVLDAIDVIIPISNPLQEPLVLDVMLNGAGITGDTNLAVGPKEVISYKARYTPHVVGERRGSVTFHSDRIGEFWYELNLTAKKPTPISLPELQCELGKRVWQVIPLANSTIETLKLEVVNSNPGVFSVEIDPRKVLVVNPQSTLEVPFQFSPSTLGKNDHCATIIFKCSQFEEWTFHLSGVGLLPQQMDPVSVSACVNSHASVIVSFENPTNEFLLVDVLMTGSEQVMHHQCPSDLLQCSNKESVFCIPLKQNQGLLLPPKGKLDIPVIFAPDDMVLYEGLLVVQIKKQDGSSWIYEMDNVTNKELRRSQGGGISAIRWLYPIYGIPETLSTKLSPAVIRCQARNRKEETMEVHLTGVVPGSSCDTTPTQTKPPCIYNQEGGQGASAGQTPTGDFFYEIQFETEKARIQMESTIAVNFVKKKWDTETGIVTITFNIIFAPYKPVSQSAMLKVQSATGGIWRFPLLLIATEPQVDDVINIEALGLNKESVICFRLTSQTRYPKPFTAHFLPCSDQAFVVSPQAGELLPLGSTGTLFTVGFTPRMYSKKYKAKLLIQTVDMQWMYEINGLDPQYIPPNVQHGKIVHKGFKQTVAVQQRNFIKENLKVITTAVSSPLKGAPLVHYK